jgi:hypothetical protein
MEEEKSLTAKIEKRIKIKGTEKNKAKNKKKKASS